MWEAAAALVELINFAKTRDTNLICYIFTHDLIGAKDVATPYSDHAVPFRNVTISTLSACFLEQIT